MRNIIFNLHEFEVHKFAPVALVLAVGVARTAVSAAPAPKLSVIQSSLTYQPTLAISNISGMSLSTFDNPLGDLAINQIMLITRVAREWANGVLIGSTGASGSLATMNVRFTPEGVFFISAVPEPGTWMSMLAGIAVLGALNARRGSR